MITLNGNQLPVKHFGLSRDEELIRKSLVTVKKSQIKEKNMANKLDYRAQIGAQYIKQTSCVQVYNKTSMDVRGSALGLGKAVQRRNNKDFGQEY